MKQMQQEIFSDMNIPQARKISIASITSAGRRTSGGSQQSTLTSVANTPMQPNAPQPAAPMVNGLNMDALMNHMTDSGFRHALYFYLAISKHNLCSFSHFSEVECTRESCVAKRRTLEQENTELNAHIDELDQKLLDVHSQMDELRNKLSVFLDWFFFNFCG